MLALFASGCLLDVGRGPDLGACADLPEGAYTWGEAGIGSCLSGPVDLAFFEQGGRTWLGVVNSNPWMTYRDGSLLLIDWESVDLAAERNLASDLSSGALSMDRFVGGFGFVPDRELGLVSGRLSEGSLTRSAEDTLWVVDLADPLAPALWETRPSLTLKDDPQPIVVDESQGLAFVVNLTDHSVSVLDTTAEALRLIDVAPASGFSTPTFTDLANSGAEASLADARALPDRELANDLWTLAWVPGSTRVWVPDATGLSRFSTAGGPLVSAGSGSRIEPSGGLVSLGEPWMTLNGGVPEMIAVDGGQLVGLRYDAAAAAWPMDEAVSLLVGEAGDWDAWPGGPSRTLAGEQAWLAYDGRTERTGAAAIGLAPWQTDRYVRPAAPTLAPPAGVSYEDPFLVVDSRTGTFRLWFSHFDGTTWRIAHAESADATTWSEPEIVLERAGGHVAAPVIAWTGHRYEAWLTLDEGDGWAHARAWSFDGLSWSEPVWALPAAAFGRAAPPRVGAIHSPVLGFTLSGANSGRQAELITAGDPYSSSVTGMAFRVVVGQAAPDDLFADAAGGLTPGSVVEFQGRTLLFSTLRDASGRPRLALAERGTDGWIALADDLVPAGSGGNEGGAEAPVAWVDGDRLSLWYAATDAFGTTRVYALETSDLASWSAAGANLLPARDFDLRAQRPGAIEPIAGGGLRLWYTGDNGSRQRLGSALLQPDGTWLGEAGSGTPWQLGAGAPGAWDDTDLADPAVAVVGDELHLWYSGFDGNSWAIGHATRPLAGGDFTRDTGAIDGAPRAALSPLPRSFAAVGVRAPVIEPLGEGRVALWFAGDDGAASRLGRAEGDAAALFHTAVLPAPGDQLSFRTRRGEPGRSVIELEQTIDGLKAPGIGVSTARLDAERGFLFIPSKLAGWIYVVDIRDDSDGDFVDHNAFDIEALIFPGATQGSQGYRDALPIPGTNLLYASSRRPDEVTVFDLSQLEDLGTKRLIYGAALASFPMQAQSTPTAAPTRFGDTTVRNEDEGASTVAAMGPAGLAVSDDARWVFATHFRDNSLTVFDRGLGAWGEVVRTIPNVGENPHLVRISPDGRHAVIANFAGEVDESQSSSTLSVVDIDPSSPTFLQVVTRIVNR